MAKAAKQTFTDKLLPSKPTTTIQGKTVAVTGTKGGAISAAQQAAKATRLQGQPIPAQVGKYAGNATIKAVAGAANPHRPGTYRHKAYTIMLGCATAGAYAATGYKPKYLARWAQLGLVRVG